MRNFVDSSETVVDRQDRLFASTERRCVLRFRAGRPFFPRLGDEHLPDDADIAFVARGAGRTHLVNYLHEITQSGHDWEFVCEAAADAALIFCALKQGLPRA